MSTHGATSKQMPSVSFTCSTRTSTEYAYKVHVHLVYIAALTDSVNSVDDGRSAANANHLTRLSVTNTI